jgi:hypothetical protein
MGRVVVAEDVVPRVFHAFCQGQSADRCTTGLRAGAVTASEGARGAQQVMGDHLAPQPGAVRAAGGPGVPE